MRSCWRYTSCPDALYPPRSRKNDLGEVGRPGYGLYDRALGACYLSGIWEAITKGSDKAADAPPQSPRDTKAKIRLRHSERNKKHFPLNANA